MTWEMPFQPSSFAPAHRARPTIEDIRNVVREELARVFQMPSSVLLPSRALGDSIQDRLDARLDRVLEIVAELYSVSADDLRGRSRLRDVSWPRMIAYYIMCTNLSLPNQDIARYMGRDHSTVSSGTITVRRRLAVVRADRELYEECVKRIEDSGVI